MTDKVKIKIIKQKYWTNFIESVPSWRGDTLDFIIQRDDILKTEYNCYLEPTIGPHNQLVFEKASDASYFILKWS